MNREFDQHNVEPTRCERWRQAQTIVSLLEGATPTRVFVMWEADIDRLGEAAQPGFLEEQIRRISLGAPQFEG